MTFTLSTKARSLRDAEVRRLEANRPLSAGRLEKIRSLDQSDAFFLANAISTALAVRALRRRKV